SVFVSILPRSPLSTLFPYTTLFRSTVFWVVGAADFQRLQTCPRDRAREGGDVIGEDQPWHHRGGQKVLDIRPYGGDFLHRLVRVDRKSTRLNSSHVKISYAVFCLKK